MLYLLAIFITYFAFKKAGQQILSALWSVLSQFFDNQPTWLSFWQSLPFIRLALAILDTSMTATCYGQKKK